MPFIPIYLYKYKLSDLYSWLLKNFFSQKVLIAALKEEINFKCDTNCFNVEKNFFRLIHFHNGGP